MWFVVGVPEALSTAAAELDGLSTALGSANATVAVQQQQVLAQPLGIEVVDGHHRNVLAEQRGLSGCRRAGFGVSRPVHAGVLRGQVPLCGRRGSNAIRCKPWSSRCSV